jgi:hypothetical protein
MKSPQFERFKAGGHYIPELGTREQLDSFFDKYVDFDSVSDDCALDGRFFWKVLAPIQGVIKSEVYIRINDLGDSEGDIKVSPVAFDYPELLMNKNMVKAHIMKLIVDISGDPTDNSGSVHSNLIVVDDIAKTVVRFEPMYEERYTVAINFALKEYFKEILPDYTYDMLDEHPQLPTTKTCPRKGMCAAYTLKKAMMILTNNDRPLNRDPDLEEQLILRFAEAIKAEYGPIEEENDENEFGRRGSGFGRRRRRSSYSKGWSGILPLMASLVTPRYFFDVGNPYAPIITPNGYPGYSMYSAPYYGYGYGPRPYRSAGWGWSRRRSNHYGSPEYGCGCIHRQRNTAGPLLIPFMPGEPNPNIKEPSK